MNTKYKVIISISFALTLFFVLPWVAIFEQTEIFKEYFPLDKVRNRFLFLTIGVFGSSIVFFQMNFFWRKKLPFKEKTWIRRFVIICINLFLVLLISTALIFISVELLKMANIFFAVYFIRNIGIAFISMLVVYAYEHVEKARMHHIKLLTLQNEKMETELTALKSQIDPHFLFNSLNSLTGVIRENQREAIHFVNHLSETFRYTLDKRNDNLVSLSEELNFMESYLYMIRKRFAKGIVIKFNIAEDDLIKKLPQFALQLLVENAIKHNVVSIRSPLEVSIFSDTCQLVVSNNLQPKKTLQNGYGIGLANLKKRYEILGYDSVIITKTKTEFRVHLLLVNSFK